MKALLVLCLLASTAAAGKPKVAILGLEPDKASATLAHDVTEGLRNRAKSGAGPFTIAPNADHDLAELKDSHNCKREATPCMAAIGAELGADLLMYGHVEKSSDGVYRIAVKLLDVAKKQVRASIADAVQNDSDAPAIAKKIYGKLTAE